MLYLPTESEFDVGVYMEGRRWGFLEEALGRDLPSLGTEPKVLACVCQTVILPWGNHCPIPTVAGQLPFPGLWWLERRDQGLYSLCSLGDSGKVTTVVATLGQGPERSQEVAYTDIKVIGNGSFGVVYQARLAETRELVAIKKVLQDKRFKVAWVDWRLGTGSDC